MSLVPIKYFHFMIKVEINHRKTWKKRIKFLTLQIYKHDKNIHIKLPLIY